MSHKGLAIEDALKITNQINNSDIEHLSLIGGEPLLYAGLRQVIEHLRDDIHLYLETNGSLVLKKWNDIYTKRFKHVSIGFEGPQFINEMERKNTQNVVDGIKFLRSLGVDVKISVVITKKNYRNVLDIIEFINELDVSSIQLNGYSRVEGLVNSDYLMSFDEKSELFNLIFVFLERRPDLKKIVNFSSWFSPSLFAYQQFELSNSSCFCGYFRGTIDSDGTFAPCTHLTNPTISNYYRDSFKLPNLLDVDIVSAFYNSDAFNFVRESIKHLSQTCKSCQYNDKCNNGCKIAAMYYGGDSLQAIDPDCDVASDIELRT